MFDSTYPSTNPKAVLVDLLKGGYTQKLAEAQKAPLKSEVFDRNEIVPGKALAAFGEAVAQGLLLIGVGSGCLSARGRSSPPVRRRGFWSVSPGIGGGPSHIWAVARRSRKLDTTSLFRRRLCIQQATWPVSANWSDRASAGNGWRNVPLGSEAVQGNSVQAPETWQR